MPGTSPGRLGRVVAETDISSRESRARSAREIEGLPAPEGEDSTSIRPRRRISTKPLAAGSDAEAPDFFLFEVVALIRCSAPARETAPPRPSDRARPR